MAKKTILAKILALVMALSAFAGFNAIAAEETNIALGKTVVGSAAANGASNESLVDGNLTNFGYQDALWNQFSTTQYFAIDLGETYVNYDIQSIEIVTKDPNYNTWCNGWNVNTYKAWMADSIQKFNGNTSVSEAELEAANATLIGRFPDSTGADTTQMTLKVENTEGISKRYVYIGHEFNDVEAGPCALTLSEIRVWATEKAVIPTTNVASGKPAYGGMIHFGLGGDSAALVDGNLNNFTIMDGTPNEGSTCESQQNMTSTFVIDLGVDYGKYDIQSIDITTPPLDAWCCGWGASQYKAWFADDYNVGRWGTYITNQGMSELGLTEIGLFPSTAGAGTEQKTVSLEIPSTVTPKRYVLVGVDMDGVQGNHVALAEIAVNAYIDDTFVAPEEVKDTRKSLISSATPVYGAVDLYGGRGNAAVVDGDLGYFVFNNSSEGSSVNRPVLVIDLGTGYGDVILEEIEIVSHGNVDVKQNYGYKVWAADNYYTNDDGLVIISDAQLAEYGAVELGSTAVPSGTAQETFSLEVTNPNKRYILIGPDAVAGLVSLSEVRIFGSQVLITADSKNVAIGKASYGSNPLYGAGDSTAMNDGNLSTYTWSFPAAEFDADYTPLFVVDLGEDYAKYDLKSVDIVTVGSNAWTFGGYGVNYTVWASDGNGEYYTEYPQYGYFWRGAHLTNGYNNGSIVQLGRVEDYSASLTAQTTYSFPIPSGLSKRYIMVGHDTDKVSGMSIAEIRVWAEVDTSMENYVNIAPMGNIIEPSDDDRELAKAMFDGNIATAYTGKASTVSFKFDKAYTIKEYAVEGGTGASILASNDGVNYAGFVAGNSYQYFRIYNAVGVTEVILKTDPGTVANSVLLRGRFQDAAAIDGNTIMDFNRENIGVEYEAINLSSKNTPSKLVFAMYDNYGKLIGVQTRDIALTSYSASHDAIGFANPDVNAGSGYFAKCFIWNSSTYAPLDEAMEMVNP